MSSPDDSNSAIVTEGNISLVDSLKKQRQFPPGEGCVDVLAGCITGQCILSPLQTKMATGYHFVFRPEINKWIYQCSVPLFTFDLKKLLTNSTLFVSTYTYRGFFRPGRVQLLGARRADINENHCHQRATEEIFTFL